jgi:uncharacterized RDD family membrane protein YckC
MTTRGYFAQACNKIGLDFYIYMFTLQLYSYVSKSRMMKTISYSKKKLKICKHFLSTTFFPHALCCELSILR